ncbi:hypothetical protein PIROE2DRAFT_1501 [Piromyces sp. E2]|nr:hypothetical protein PIROE2DRAFT_1501 [Piromyces sp. E2]|eukprot:OUM70361.1 hypothetical protein PIROE2DRAFT_1501 [Piromyces sp. E2]
MFLRITLANTTTNKIIYCNNEKTCTTVDDSELNQSKYYISGFDYRVANNVEATTVHTEYYLNGDGLTAVTVTFLFNCDSEAYSKAMPYRADYYFDGSGFISSGKYSKLIQCIFDSEACHFKSINSSNMSTPAKEITGETKVGYGYVDFGTSNTVITCTDGTCILLTSGNAQSGTFAQNTGFLDAGKLVRPLQCLFICFNDTAKTFGKIITCNTTGSCTPLTTLPMYTSAEAYIDVDADCTTIVGNSETGDSKYYTDVLTAAGNIITYAGPTDSSIPTVIPTVIPCASGSHAGTTVTTITCTALEAITGDDTYYYIDVSSTDKIIKCDKSSYNNSTAANTDLAMPYINPNATDIIQCAGKVVDTKTVTECEYKEGSSAILPLVYYIEAAATKNIITCKTSGSKSTCDMVEGITDDGYAYMDYVNTGNIIKCPGNVCASSTSMAVAATKQLPVQNPNYINGYDNTKKTIITCINSDSQTPKVNCTSTALKTVPNYGQVFLEGTTYSSGYVKLIKWDTTNNYLVVDAPTNAATDGFAFIDDSDKALKRIITYESNKYVAKDSAATDDFNKYYITGLNTTNIITCTKDGCASHTGSSTKGEAYINGIDTTKVITCATGGTGCTSAAGVGSTNTADSYINANDISQVINCTSKNCTVFDAEFTDHNSIYYPRYVSGAKALLNCTKSGGSVGCELTETSADNHKSSVFINSFNGYDDYDQEDSLPLISCDATASYKPIMVEIEDESPKFYPNSDLVNSKPLLNDLIKCVGGEDDGVTCSITSGGKNEVYLSSNFNTSTKQLLICLEEDGCVETKVNSTSPEYYVNAGSVSEEKLADTLIKCTSTATACTIEEANDSEIYINQLDNSQTIQCYTDKGCIAVPSKATTTKNEIFLNSSDLNTENQTKLAFDLIKCEMDENNEITCESADGIPNEVYINSHNTTEIIYCTSDGCTNKASEAEPTQPEYYINADPTDAMPLTGDLIKCKNTGNKITCEVTNGKHGDVFLNANVDNDSDNNPLIICSAMGCQTDASQASEDSLPAYYVNAGSVLASKLNDTLIQCTYEEAAECFVKVAEENDVYVNYSNNTDVYQLIKCTKSGCKTSVSAATENNNEYYLNDGDTGDKALDFDIIECVKEDGTVTCAELEDTGVGVYLNSNYAESGDTNQLIQCQSDSGCDGIKTSGKSMEYYVNAEAVGLNNAIIYCSNKKCEKQSPGCANLLQRKRATEKKLDLGYYVNAGDTTKPIIKCEKEGSECATTSISVGNICTNADRFVFYFSTDTVVVKPNVIFGVTATYVYITSNSNCIEVNDSYTDMYFTVAKNAFVNGNDIDAYNDENVKLYKCNNSSCAITDKPDSLTYYVDVNKRIIRYNINSDSYSFAYDKDITCIFANNKCTPNADLKNQEFCVTYKGELALAKADIKNRKTGEYYKAGSITNTIYGYSQHLYNMNVFSAEMIDETGYYIVNLSTNTTVVSKNNNLVVYDCQLSSCKEYSPDENTYYYDVRAKTILRYKDSIWHSPTNSGYAYISIDPTTNYIYCFTKKLDEIKIQAMANFGYYYIVDTVEGEMYHCDRDEGGEYSLIDNTGYYFTNASEVYYCVHDSRESLQFPDKIKQAMDGVEKNNNSTAIVTRHGKSYLESVSGVFTNCTCNVEETKSTFDLVCVNNFVSLHENTDNIKICSVEQLGYVECIEDEENSKKLVNKINICYGV